MKVKICPVDYCFECPFNESKTGKCTKPWEERSFDESQKKVET